MKKINRKTNLHSTMFLLIPVHFPPLIHTVSRLPNCRPLYFLPHPPLFFLLIFLLSNILLQKYELCRLPTFSALSQVDNHRKLLVLSSWMPQNSFGIHFSFLHLKIIKESLSSRMTLFNSIFSFRSCDSDISPSKTEFWIRFKYLRHNFSIFPTLFSPKSYTRITYISLITNTF